VETGKKFTTEQIQAALSQLTDAVRFGTILRAKGIVQGQDGKWIHFDYVPNEVDVRHGSAAYTGRLCVIGSKIDEEELKELFGV
jgi:G3E family GTPase